jgi:Family of unknown function (DUF5762)
MAFHVDAPGSPLAHHHGPRAALRWAAAGAAAGLSPLGDDEAPRRSRRPWLATLDDAGRARDDAHELVWYEDIAAFLDTDNLLDFWPAPAMSIEHRVNAATRFLVYASALLFVTTRRTKYLVFGMLLIGMLSYVYWTCSGRRGPAGSTLDVPRHA